MHTETEKLHQKRIQKGGFKMNESREEKIDRYLKGSMTDEETRAFEAELQEDDALRMKTTEQALVIKSIRDCAHREDERITKAIQSMSEAEFIYRLKNKITNSSTPKRRFRWAAWTTATAACISGMVYLYTQHIFYAEIKTELIEAQDLNKSPTQEVLRGGEIDLASFQKFHQASGYILQKDYTCAIPLLESIVEEGDINYYYQDACWQLSLCYILNKNKQKAITLLQQIVAEEQYQAEKALSLLKQLR